jgi:hypothetical protein
MKLNKTNIADAVMIILVWAISISILYLSVMRIKMFLFK